MEQHIETKCVQAGWTPKTGEARTLPVYQSTTFKYEDAKTLGDLFDFKAGGHFYTRLSNPTLEAVEQKITALEGGIGAMLTASGQAAATAILLTVCAAGDHVITSNALYGGTYNLFNVTLRRMGIDFTFVSPDADDAALEAALRPNTKLVFGETLSNPGLQVLDVERFSAFAHRHSLPLVVDNTFPTPLHCRPIEFGADIVMHSTSKYMDGHAVSLGGVVVDSGRFDWAASPRHSAFSAPDDSYHGLVFTDRFGPAAFIAKARAQIMRDVGLQMSPTNAFLLNLGLETLHLRMPRHVENARRVARWLKENDKISYVQFPELPDDPNYELARKYMPDGTCGVIAFGVKGGRDAACALMERLKLAAPVIHVADVRTCVLHPASTTHRQLSDAQLAQAGIGKDLIRMSVGIERAEDIIADLEQALSGI